MTQYVRQFLEEAPVVGSGSTTICPAGFSAIYLQSPFTLQTGTANNGAILTVALDGGTPKYVGDRYARFDCTAGALSSGHRIMFGWDVVSADATRADFEILTRFHPTLAAPLRTIALGARCSGTDSAWNGYFFEIRPAPTNVVAIMKGVAGVDTDLATAAVTVPTTGPVWMRAQGRGTTLKLKVWTGEISDEPAAYTTTVVDATYAAAGAIGWGAKTAFDNIPSYLNLAFLSAGTGTDAAPAPPKTWQDYLSFLALQDTLRCLLGEIDPLGQDSSGNALTARVCASTMPFVSKPSDYPYPNVCYEEIIAAAPKIKRRMSDVLRGRSTISYGDMEWVNEISNDDLSGRLDAWFSWNWDGRQVRLLLGHPTWRRVDFKTVFLGAIASVYRAAYGRIGFKLRGPEVRLMNPVSTALIGGAGPNANALAPVVFSSFFNAEPILYDAASLTYQVEAPSFSPKINQNLNHDVRVGGSSLKQPVRTITAVNAGTDTLTADAPHNLSPNSSWISAPGSSALPAPLVAGTRYFVKTINTPNPNDFTLSLTKGGTVIDITGSTTGGTFIGRNYDWDPPNGRIALLIDPLGKRPTVDYPDGNLAVSIAVLNLMQPNGFAQDTYHGVFLSQAVSKWTSQQWILGDAIDETAGSVGASWNFTREGCWYLTVLDVPGTTAAWTINSDDIRNWRTGERWLPSTVERLGYQPNNTIEQGADLVDVVTPLNRDLYGKPYSLASYSPTETGLEQPANHLLADNPIERPTLLQLQADAQTEVQRLYFLRRKARATYLFDTDAWALAAELGDVLGTTYPCDGFNNGKNAMIVGATDDLSTFSSELEIFGQIDGQWPVVTAIQPFASESYY